MPDDTAAEPSAAVAALRRELAQAQAERDEALARETAMAEVLQVINASPGDLAPVFDAILEKALRLCDAAFGSFQTFNGDAFTASAQRGWPTELAENLRSRRTLRPREGSLLHRLVRGEELVQVEDISASTLPSSLGGREALVKAGARTMLWIALRKDGALFGAINIYRQDVRPFTDKQIALLQNFAAQAVIAMENARLLTETQEALEQQTATAEVLGVINSSPGDLAPVFDAILEKAHSLCDVAYGSLQLYDGEMFRAVAVRGLLEPFAERLRKGYPAGASNQPLIDGEGFVHVCDLSASEDPMDETARDLAGTRTVLFVALRKDGLLLGKIVAARREVRPFTDKQIALLQNFAAQAVIAMENARLLTETREALEQQTATAEVLGVINASPGELAPVFDAILEKAHIVCDSPSGSLQVLEDGQLRAVATRGLVDSYAAMLRKGFNPSSTWQNDEITQVDIAELAAAHPENEMFRCAEREAKLRTVLFVPLLKEGAVVGRIAASRYELRPFTDKQIALLQNFAAQAVIAMENARLLTETREALEQQTATAEVLGVINSSPGDLSPVFNAILEKAHSLCDATQGALVTYNGEFFQAAATHRLAEGFEQILRQPFRCAPGSSQERLLQGEHFVQVEDYQAIRTESDDPVRRSGVGVGGARTVLFIPLRKDNSLAGYISALRQEVRPFTDKQIALLQNFAAQAVIAMENARLITETREALEQQTATAEVLGVINASPGDLAPVFDAVLEKAMRLCEATSGHIWQFDGEHAHTVALRGDADFLRVMRQRVNIQPTPGGSLDRVVRGEPLVYIADATKNEVYRLNPEYRDFIDQAGTRTSITVGLKKDEALLGAIVVHRREVRPFTDKQIALLENFAAQAVIAMENARLLGELRQRNDEIAGWNKELEDRVAAQLGELERVGKLKRFLAPQLAELIVARGDEAVLETHRRDIVVVFCDLRDFTAFAETAEPEEVLDLLREYHAALGPIVSASEGTLDHFSGDGIMVFFNDPVPVADASERAVRMATQMREAMAGLQAQWRRQGRRIGFGAGIARGYATLGQIGFADRVDYTAIGTVCNLAARLCAEAKDGQILLSQRVAAAVEDAMPLEEIGEVTLKGLREPVAVYSVPLPAVPPHPSLSPSGGEG